MTLCRRFALALTITMMLASMGDFTQPAGAQVVPAEPARALLSSFNLPDGPAFIAMVEEAAGRLAAANARSGGSPTDRQGVLEAAATDRRVYIKLAPHVLSVAMEAISTRNPTPAQQEFYRTFQRYYADLQQFTAIRTLGAWNTYRGTKVFPETIIIGGQSIAGQIFAPPEVMRPPVEAPIGVISMLIDTGKPASGFVPPRDVLPMSPEGAIAIAEVFGPMALSESPESANLPFAAGGDTTTAALAGLGMGLGVGTVAVGVAFGTVIGTTTAINATLASGAAAAVAVGNAEMAAALSAGIGQVALFGAASAVTVVSSVLIVIPLFVAAGMKIASVIETNNFEAALVKAAAKPDYNIDIRALVDPVYVQDAGLWYKDCAAGHRGVATRCYQDCEAGYVDDGLLCRRPPDSFGKDSYQRGVGILQCRPGLVNDAGLCYPECPGGWRGVATRCYANCPARIVPGTRLQITIYRDDGLFCAKGLDFGRGAGYVIWEQGTCERNHGVGNCELQGLLWYPRCPAGYHQTTVNFCSQDCPQGWSDIGVSCPKPFFDRGVGVAIDSCSAGSERLGALCYPLCRDGYSSPGGLPNTCMSTTPCPAGYNDTGFTCLRNLHVYAKGFYDRGVGTVNRPADSEREVARKAMFTYLVRMLVADPAGRNAPSAPVQTRSAAACPAGMVAQGALCGTTVAGTDSMAPTIRLDRTNIVVEGVNHAHWDASASVAADGGPLTITWDFGDGASATGPVADHPYTKAGTYRVTITATDGNGRTSKLQVDVAVVASSPSALTLVLGPSIEGAPTMLQGRFLPGDPARAHTVEVAWGDGATDSVAVPGNDPAFALAHRYGDNGARTVQVTVRDDAGSTTSALAELNVANAAPNVSAALDGEARLDLPAKIVGETSDLGIDDTVTLVIDWGDGTVEQLNLASRPGPYTASHPYTRLGEFGVTVTVIDDDGGVATAAVKVVVADLTPAGRASEVIETLGGATSSACQCSMAGLLAVSTTAV